MTARRSMVRIPAGTFRPLYRSNGGDVAVKEFWLDLRPVSRAEFVEFVKCRPDFRRSALHGVFAESEYLHDWQNDLDAGADAQQTPVLFVSWFAARAHCESLGKRLPTTAEWERILGRIPPQSPVAEPGGDRSPFGFAMGRPAADLAGSGISAARTWEWTDDFNSTPLSTGTSSNQFCGDGIRANNPSDYAAFLRYSFRSSLKANYTLKNLGFRCASDGPL